MTSHLFSPITIGGLTLANRIAVSPMCQYSAVEALERIVATCRRWGNSRLGLQFAHAGRKASVHVPWQGAKPLSATEGAWQGVAASPIAFDHDWPTPQALDAEGLARIRDAFAVAARRADRLGFDLAELQGAHGYLLHGFLSPAANRRDDRYCGSSENRMRFPLEVAAAVRAVWPSTKALGMRITGFD